MSVNQNHQKRPPQKMCIVKDVRESQVGGQQRYAIPASSSPFHLSADTYQVDALVIENRNLKTQLEDVRLRLEKAEKVYSVSSLLPPSSQSKAQISSSISSGLTSVQADQASIASQKELLQQAETALTQYQSQITTLQTQLTTQAQSVMNEKQSKEQAEVTMHAAKTQLSKIAKEKHELVVELGKMREGLEKAEKRFKYAEDARGQLSQEVKNLQVS